MTTGMQDIDIHELMGHLARIANAEGDLPDPDTPMGMITREFFDNNWLNCRDALLTKTSRIQVLPEQLRAPRIFRFTIETPYKRKQGQHGAVELMPGPVRGTIHYRPNVFVDQDPPPIAVRLDADLDYFHPNCSREHFFVCLGDLPPSPYPLPLDLLLADHLYPILTYQNRRPAHPLDREAARYFALDPEAMAGLDVVEPLY